MRGACYNSVEPMSSIIPSCWTLYIQCIFRQIEHVEIDEEGTNLPVGLVSRRSYGWGRRGRILRLGSCAGVARLSCAMEVSGGGFQG